MTKFFIFYKIIQIAGMAICTLFVNDIYAQLQAKYSVLQYAADKEKTAELFGRLNSFQSLQSICTVFIVSCLCQIAALFYKSGSFVKQ